MINHWVRFFSLKQQGPRAGEMSDCGAAVISKRSGADYPKMPLEDSAKKWQNSFFYDFLEFFGLQPHHLGTGAIVQLSGFVTLCEGYLGVAPTIDLWARFFSLK